MKDSLFSATLIEQSPDCISGYDAALNIILWNKACEKKFSIAKELAIGKSLLTLFPKIEKDHRVQCLQNLCRKGPAFSLLISLIILSQAFTPKLLYHCMMITEL